MTRNQAGNARAKGAQMRDQARVKSARWRAQAARSAPARRARRAATRMTPVAIGTGLAARRGVRAARIWAAPQLERAGHSLEQELAPRMASMMIATAHRIEPPRAQHRLRWPLFTAGAAVLAGGGAAAAYVLARRSNGAGPSSAPTAVSTSAATTAGTSTETPADSSTHTPTS